MIKNENTYCTVQHKIVREVGAWEAVVYGTITNLLRKTDGIGEVSNQTIMDLCGINNKMGLYRYIKKLIETGYIEKRAGDGRGNISIYYVTKKGNNMLPFNDKKGNKNDTERVTKMNEKGNNMLPINKGENKEINKESGGDNTRDAREIPTLSNTTTFLKKEENETKNKITMEDYNGFEEFWTLYPGDPEWSHEREACERAWYSTRKEWCEKLVCQLRNGQRWRAIDQTNRERNNPIWYIKNYSGEDAQGELPYICPGTATFGKWAEKNTREGIKMCMIRYDGHIAYCLESDIQTMINAGAELIKDDWR